MMGMGLLIAAVCGGLWHADIWYAVPLVVALSLVYAATRHEDLKGILHHALRMGAILVAFMGGIFLVLWYFSQGL
jgi:hypothetical protein